MNKKLFTLLLSTTLLASVLVGCSSNTEPQPLATDTPTAPQPLATDTPTAPQPLGTNKESVSSLTPTTEGHIGAFETQDIFGNTVTEAIFADNDLTLVNIYTTWCSPCVKEIPDLQAIDAEMTNVGVVGFVMDIIDPATNAISQAKLDIAHQLVDKTGAEYPMLLPCPELLDGRLEGITSYPESFFVDKNGQIVGETYVGAHDKQGWIDVINETLALLE